MNPLWLLPILAAHAEAEGPHRYALVIGSNDGGPGRAPLRYAHTDAAAMGQVLVELGGVASGDRVTLLDPGRGQLIAAFGNLRQRMAGTERNEVVVYYSGHSDEQGLLLDGDRFGYDELKTALEKLPASVRVAILDSCASGAMLREKGGKRTAPFLMDVSSTVEGYAFLTSASEDEAAQEADRLRASFFTHHLVSGLRGAADLSQDGRVTLNEAYQFAFSETLEGTERTAAGPQHPAYDIRMSGTGDLVLTDLRQVSAGLVLAEDVDGRAFVRDASGDLVAELFKPAGRPIELGLSPGRYEVTVRQDERFAALDVTIAEGQRLGIQAGDLSWRAGEVARLRGDARLPVTLEKVPFETWLIPDGSGQHEATVALGLLGVAPGAVDGAALSAGVNVVGQDLSGLGFSAVGHVIGGDAAGVLVSPVFSVIGGDLAGVHVGGGPLIVGGDKTGLQMSLLSITGGTSRGVDLNGVFGITERSAGEAQVSGVFNISGEGTPATQMAGVYNISGGDAVVQVGGVFNIAGGTVRGAQVSGVFNVEEAGRGVQLGVVNIAKEHRGVQLGLVNVADDSDVPFGLVNVIKNGYHSLGVSTSVTAPVSAELKLGGRYFYNVIGIAAPLDDHWDYSLGLGGHLPMGRWVFADLDGLCHSMGMAGWPSAETTNLLVQGRLQLGVTPIPHVAPFVGATYDLWIPMNDESVAPTLPGWAHPWGEVSDDGLSSWIGYVAGMAATF